jgi:hypothetical protein
LKFPSEVMIFQMNYHQTSKYMRSHFTQYL